MSLRKFSLRMPAVLLMVVLGAPPSLAQEYPQKRISFIVPGAPGGIADTMARLIGLKMSETFGQPVVVENKTGAGGNIAADFVAKSPPDGHTIVMGILGSHAVNPSLLKQMPYDAARDFAPVALVAEAEGMLVVHPSVKATTTEDLIALARAEPGKLTYASGGLGTASHLAGELFKSMAKVDIVHIPYRGNAPALLDLVAGQTMMQFATMPTVLPHTREGKLRSIAVIGSARSAAAPELPTIAESGLPGYNVNNWIGVFAPAGTPAAIVAKLNAEINRILQTPEMQKRLETEGARATPTTPEQFGEFVRAEANKWAKLIKEAGIIPQ